MKKRKSLLGINRELDGAVKDIAVFGNRYGDMHPAATGDICQVMSERTSQRLIRLFKDGATKWFSMQRINQLSSIRGDGRAGYRSEGIENAQFYEHIRGLEGRVLLITCTGSQIPTILETLRAKEDGRFLNLVEVRVGGSIRILYGNREFGTIPSIELHAHMLAAGISINHGIASPGIVHAHPYHLTLLGMDDRINGVYESFNAAIYSQIEGLNRNVPNLIGVAPYAPSGSRELLRLAIPLLLAHELSLWMNHGFIVRSFHVERAYALLSYAKQAARAALDVLRFGGHGLPFRAIGSFLKEHNLLEAYKRLGFKGSNEKRKSV